MKVLILSSSKQHILNVKEYDTIITCGHGYAYFFEELPSINVACDPVVSEALNNDVRSGYYNNVQFYYSSWNGGACNYFNPYQYHLPFTNKLSSGSSAMLLAAYMGADEIALSKGNTRARIDGRQYTTENLLRFHKEQEKVAEMLQQNWGYQTIVNNDDYMIASDIDKSKINKQRWVKRVFEQEII